MSRLKIGDLVLIDKAKHNRSYGSRLALVVALSGQNVTVSTGTFELLYEAQYLELHATIALDRQYATPAGNRFRNYEIVSPSGNILFRGSACVREGARGATVTGVLPQKLFCYEGYKTWITRANEVKP